jgi:hypothetical protein
MSAVVLYQSEGPLQLGEAILDDGSRVRVALAADGVTIERLAAPGTAQAVLCRASPGLAACIAVSFGDRREPAPPVLDVVLALVIRLGSAAAIAGAFAAAAGAYAEFGRP